MNVRRLVRGSGHVAVVLPDAPADALLRAAQLVVLAAYFVPGRLRRTCRAVSRVARVAGFPHRPFPIYRRVVGQLRVAARFYHRLHRHGLVWVLWRSALGLRT